MSCWSFSLPAGKDGACPMAIHNSEDDICHGCYAQINRYNMPNVLTAQWVRFWWTKQCLSTDTGRRAWVEVMTQALKDHVSEDVPYFRWFDSGDIFSPKLAKCLTEVCNNTPNIHHWFPTRSWWSKNPTWNNALAELAALSNVTVRPSAIKFNDPPPTLDYLSRGTTVLLEKEQAEVLGVARCAKSFNGGSCGSHNCRACWDEPNTPVGYLVHGYLGKKQRPDAYTERIQETRKYIKQKAINLTIGAT